MPKRESSLRKFGVIAAAAPPRPLMSHPVWHFRLDCAAEKSPPRRRPRGESESTDHTAEASLPALRFYLAEGRRDERAADRDLERLAALAQGPRTRVSTQPQNSAASQSRR